MLLPVLVGMVGVGAIGYSVTVPWAHAAGEVTARDMNGHTVVLDPGVTPEPCASASPVVDPVSRFQVPSVGLDVPLGALDAVDGQITPPGFTSAYRIRNRGVPLGDGANGTVFVVMHALRGGGRAPGNYLEDVHTGSSAVAEGASVIVDGVRYLVTGSTTVSKSTISTDTTVWANTPGRLVLITCMEHANGTPSTRNLVIYATRTPSTTACS